MNYLSKKVWLLFASGEDGAIYVADAVSEES